MAMTAKDVLIRIALVGLLFLGIPININNPHKSENHLLFQSYMKKYQKSYKKDSIDYELRFRYFEESLRTIEKLNSVHPNEDSAIYGLTEFSDLSPDEFKHHHLQRDLYKRLRKHRDRHVSSAMHHGHNHHNHVSKRAISSLPDKVDWRDKKVVTAVRNQKLCGACWAFSTIETVESMLAIKNGTLLNLSVQEIIDCAQNGNLGCDGGDTCSLLDWLTENKIKIEVESNYPLKLKNGVCKLPKTIQGVIVASDYSCDYLVGNENALLQLLAYHGPVAVAVNALTWQYYIGGVIQFHCSGGPYDINHAVQIVGYDKTAPTPHYIVRNSWGTAFGNSGYLYLAIGSNVCGVATEVLSVLSTLFLPPLVLLALYITCENNDVII